MHTPDSHAPRSRIAMPTLLACGASCIALVVAVGLQTPAVSVGVRWKPRPRFRPPDRYIEPLDFAGHLPVLREGNGWPVEATWTIATLVALLLVVLIVRLIRHLTRRPPAVNVARTRADSGTLSEANAQILQSGLAAAIEILASNPNRGNAIVQAWQGLEDAAAAAGLHRRPAETASEFTARILYRSRKSAEPISALLTLYQRVRFGEYTPDADDISAARNALATLVDLWRNDFPERRPAKQAH